MIFSISGASVALAMATTLLLKGTMLRCAAIMLIGLLMFV
jgi:hypothetical protein